MIGTLDEVYIDTTSEQPEWLRVSAGVFGGRHHFVPLRGAAPDGEDAIRVDHSKETVKNAPAVEDDGTLSTRPRKTSCSATTGSPRTIPARLPDRRPPR